MDLPIKDVQKLHVVGDRILVKPRSNDERTRSGLYLPPTVTDEDTLQSGYVIKVGPGYPIPSTNDESDFWKDTGEKARYIPLQAESGDLAIYLRKYAYEIHFEGEKFFIVPFSAVLLLYREDF